MYRNQWICSLFLFSFIKSVVVNIPNITVLHDIESYNSYCIISNNTESLAIVWNTSDINNNPISVYKEHSRYSCVFSNTSDCTTEWIVDDWTLQNSLSFKFGPIFDFRWEQLKIEKTSSKYLYIADIKNKTEFEVPISIRYSKDANIFLCDTEYPPVARCYWFVLLGWKAMYSVFRKCPENNIPLTEDKYPQEECKISLDNKTHTGIMNTTWKHFILKGLNNTYSIRNIEEEQPFLKYTDHNNTYEPKYIIIKSREKSEAVWKIHSYWFIYTTNEGETYLGPWHYVEANKIFCFAFYLNMCEHCKLYVTLVAKYTQATLLDLEFRYQESEWKEQKIVTKVNYGTHVRLLFKTESNQYEKFWAIDNPRLCSNEEIRVSALKDEKERRTDCYAIKYPKTKVLDRPPSESLDSSCPVNTFGKNCVACAKVLSNQYCTSWKICELDEDGKTICSCPAGLMGQQCKTSCVNFYGFGCKEKCGKCNEPCNYIDGSCESCENNYKGFTCKMAINPILKYPAHVNWINDVSVSLELSSNEYEGSNSPRYYFIRYCESEKQTCSDTKWYNFDDRFAKTVYNLSPQVEYRIKIILVPFNNTYYDGKYIQETKIRTCTDVLLDDILILTNTDTATIRLKNSSHTCPSNMFTLAFNNLTLNATNYEFHIDHLEPYTTYIIKIINNNSGVEIETQFQTNAEKPDRVESLHVLNSSPTSITLDWQPPKKPGIIAHYDITYYHLQHMACNTVNKDSLSKGKLKTMKTSLVVTHLKPYSIYVIEVRAVAILDGDYQIITAETLETDTPSEKEGPTVMHFQDDNVLTIYLTDECANIEGTLVYVLKLSCNYAWCSPIERLFVRGPYETKINFEIVGNIYYQLDIYLKRTNGAVGNRLVNLKIETKPTKPPPINDLMVYSKTRKSVDLRWSPPYPPQGKIELYNIEVCKMCVWWQKICDDKIISATPCKIWPDMHCYTYTELEEGCKYKTKIKAKNVNTRFGYFGNVVMFTTNIERSEPPINVTGVWDDYYNLTLTWFHPNATNGPLDYFRINLLAKQISKVYKHEVKEPNLTYTHMINAVFFTSSRLKINVYAANKAGFSKHTEFYTNSPPKTPKLSSDPEILTAYNTSVKILLPELVDLEGEASYMYIIVSDKHSTKKPELTSKTLEDIWNKANLNANYFSWIAIERHLNVKDDTRKEVSIGNDTEKYSRRLQMPIIDRILNTNTMYTISVLLENIYQNKSRHKVYKFDYETVMEDTNYDEEESSNVFIIVIVTCVVFVCAIILILIRKYKVKISVPQFVMANRTVGNRRTPDVIPFENIPTLSAVTKLKPKAPDAADQSNIVFDKQFSRSVKISEFEAYVKQSIENGELERQHDIFPRGQTKPWVYGTKPQNKTKNRYNNLAAYDHSRVKLEVIGNDPYSDYINANYIEGYNTKNAYIATQGPKLATLDDFWRMIWQESIEYIVMLAHIYEGGKKKVEKYWPDVNQTLEFGQIKVRFICVDVFADYEHRKFSVTFQGEQRKINQLHFMAWPDHGIPLYAQSLVPLLRKMLTIPQGKAPILVHCSAGVGRSGTIILCDISLRMAAREGQVDVLYYQHKLRESRANMVDNYEQYKLVHLVILHCLIAPETSIACDENFPENVGKVLQGNEVILQMKYLDETAWQDEAMSTRIADEDYPIFPEKNRVDNIIPDERCRIFLTPDPTSGETSAYINAVGVDGFQCPLKFIVTQQPLPNTIGDFWRMVHERESTLIISLNTIDSIDQRSGKFWPSEDSPILKPVPYLTITYISTLTEVAYDIMKFQLEDENSEDGGGQIIRIIQVRDWTYNNLHPETLPTLLRAYEEMNRLGKTSEHIVIMCYDGARASGLFVALSFVIDKIKLEQVIDVCLAVRTVRHSRSEFVRYKEQFAFLYRSAVEYINGFETYSNFASGKK